MGGGVIRAAAKVAGAGIVNTGLRGGVLASPSSAEFAGDIEEEVLTVISGGGKPMARVLFGGVPTLEEAKEATTDLKNALDKAYLSSPNWTDDTHSSGSTLLSKETKVRIPYDVKTTSAPKPVVQAIKLLEESPALQFTVASVATDPNVWDAVLHNPAYMDFIRSHKTNYAFEHKGCHRSYESSSVKIEDFLDAYQSQEVENPFLDFAKKFKTRVVEMANKATDFLQSLFILPSAETEKGNAESNYFEKTIGASLIGLAVMVIMVVLLKRV